MAVDGLKLPKDVLVAVGPAVKKMYELVVKKAKSAGRSIDRLHVLDAETCTTEALLMAAASIDMRTDRFVKERDWKRECAHGQALHEDELRGLVEIRQARWAWVTDALHEMALREDMQQSEGCLTVVDKHDRALLRDHVLTRPVIGQIYTVTVEHWHTKGRRIVKLRHVDEGDCSWRVFEETGYESELSYDWNVVEIRSLN